MNIIPVAQVYAQIIDLYQDRSRFAQGYYQYDKNGNKSSIVDGYSFCALGAVQHFNDHLQGMAVCCLQRVSEHLYDGQVI
jgi:hypothetical protein